MKRILNALARAAKYLFFPSAGRCPYCCSEMGNGCVCERCRDELGVLRLNTAKSSVKRAVYRYSGTARRAVTDLKFNGKKRLARLMATDMARLVHEDTDIITFVPLHTARQRARGFNQSELIAGHLAELTGIPAAGLLMRCVNTSPQSGIADRDKRRANVKGAFLTVNGADIKGKNVLLTDDVITSGATAAECVKELEKLKPASVRVLTYASAE